MADTTLPSGHEAGTPHEQTLQGILLAQSEAADRYAETREEIVEALTVRGLSQSDIKDLIESFERNWRPGYGDGESRSTNNVSARQAMDESLREQLGPEVFGRFVTALKGYRETSATAGRSQESVYSLGGARMVERALDEVGRLRAVRSELIAEAHRINPDLTADTSSRLFGNDQEAADGHLDPVRKTIALSLDVAKGTPRREMLEDLWPSLESLLSDEEKTVLHERFRTEVPRSTYESVPEADVLRKAIVSAFVDYAAPAGVRKPDPLMSKAFKPISRFLEKGANLARGRGFIDAETVWKRALDGRIGTRTMAEKGLRVADRQSNPAAQGEARSAVAKMSDSELARALEDQNEAIYSARGEKSSVVHRLFVTSAPARGLQKAARFFSSESRDPLVAENLRMRELLQGRVLLLAERNKRVRTIATSAGMDFGPEPGPVGPGPDRDGGPGGQAAAFTEQLRQTSAEHEQGGATIHHLHGAGGAYRLSEKPGSENPYQTLSMTVENGRQVTLGAFRDNDTAVQYMAKIDGSLSTGIPTPQATDLASKATMADKANNANADIDLIRTSGLLDKVLDDAIASKDMMAFAYPLKTGDILWEEPPGKWRAGTLEEMSRSAVERGDAHLENAYEAVQGAQRQRDGDKRHWLSVPKQEEHLAIAAGAVFDPLEERYYAPTPAVEGRTNAWRMAAAPQSWTASGHERESISAQRPVEQPPLYVGDLDGDMSEQAVRSAAFSMGAIVRPKEGWKKPDFAAMNDAQLQKAAELLQATISKNVGAPTNAEDARRRFSLKGESTALGEVMAARGLSTATRQTRSGRKADKGHER